MVTLNSIHTTLSLPQKGQDRYLYINGAFIKRSKTKTCTLSAIFDKANKTVNEIGMKLCGSFKNNTKLQRRIQQLKSIKEDAKKRYTLYNSKVLPTWASSKIAFLCSKLYQLLHRIFPGCFKRDLAKEKAEVQKKYQDLAITCDIYMKGFGAGKDLDPLFQRLETQLNSLQNMKSNRASQTKINHAVVHCHATLKCINKDADLLSHGFESFLEAQLMERGLPNKLYKCTKKDKLTEDREILNSEKLAKDWLSTHHVFRIQEQDAQKCLEAFKFLNLQLRKNNLLTPESVELHIERTTPLTLEMINEINALQVNRPGIIIELKGFTSLDFSIIQDEKALKAFVSNLKYLKWADINLTPDLLKGQDRNEAVLFKCVCDIYREQSYSSSFGV